MGGVPSFCEDDYPGFTFDVVSPELPCGAAWLANCFLELNVPVWRPWDIEIENEWKRLAPFHYQYADVQLPWKQNLPALQYLREFHFKAEYAAFINHRWPFPYEQSRPLIFFVRDPRDALYSYWRRAKHNEKDFNLSFENFVNSRYFHHPFSFREYLLVFLQLWRSRLEEQSHLIVRFEDYRRNSQKTLIKILDFLNIPAETDLVSRALACSDFAAVKRVEDQLEKEDQLDRRFNYAGTAFEYQNHYTPAMHNCIGTDFDEVCEWLGYASYYDACYQSNTKNAWAVP